RRLRRVDPKATSTRDPESLPFRISLGRAAKLNKRTKEFSDLLGPLKRYLRRQVDRPWDKVWSEICKNLKAENPAQRHVRLHVHDLVAINASVRDGAVWVASLSGRARPLADSIASHYELYVDPRTGILRRNKHYRTIRQWQREMAAAGKLHRATRVREV